MPATSPEAKENELIGLAVDLAEKQLRDGSASSQVISHFLKLASTREALEKERLSEENRLLRAKTEAINQERESKQTYDKIVETIMSYMGGSIDPEAYE